MSDDLERILHETKPRRPTPIDPHVSSMPRVHGGQPSQGELTQTPQRTTPEVTLVQDRPPLFNGPHFNVSKEDNTIETSVTIIPTVQPAIGPVEMANWFAADRNHDRGVCGQHGCLAVLAWPTN